jgi:hypothetical protein
MMKLADIDQVQVEKIIVNFHGLTPFCLKNKATIDQFNNKI